MANKFLLFFLSHITPQASVAIIYFYIASLLADDIFSKYVIVDSIYQIICVVLLLGNDKSIERLSFNNNRRSIFNLHLILSSSISSFIIMILLILLLYYCYEYLALIFGIKYISKNYIILLCLICYLFILYSYSIAFEYKKLNPGYVLILKLSKTVIFLISILVAFEYRQTDIINIKLFSDFISLLFPLSLYGLYLYYSKLEPIKISNIYKSYKFSWRYSIPFYVTMLSSILIINADKLIINKYLSNIELVNFALAQKINLIFILVSGGIASIGPPIFFKNYKYNKNSSAGFINDINSVVSITYIIFIFCIPLITNYILSDRGELFTFYILLISSGAYFSIYISNGTALFILQDKKSAFNMLCGLSAATISLGICYIYINKFGVWSAIIGYNLSLYIVFAIQYLYIIKHHNDIKLNLKWTIICHIILISQIFILTVNKINIIFSIIAIICILIYAIKYFKIFLHKNESRLHINNSNT